MNKQDYTKLPEFGLEWEKWLQTKDGKAYSSQADFNPYPVFKSKGIVICLSQMLATRDAKISELENRIKKLHGKT